MKKKVTKILSVLIAVAFTVLSVMMTMPVEAKAEDRTPHIRWNSSDDKWEVWDYDSVPQGWKNQSQGQFSDNGFYFARTGDYPTVHLLDGSKWLLTDSSKYFNVSGYGSLPIKWIGLENQLYLWCMPTVTYDADGNWDSASGSTVVTLVPNVTWILIKNYNSSGIEIHANGELIQTYTTIDSALNIDTRCVAEDLCHLEAGVKIRLNWETHDNVINFTYTTITDPQPSSGNACAHEHNFEWQTITEPTLYSDGLAGDVCTICGYAKNTQPVSAFGYAINDYATKLVEAAKSGQTITLDLGEWNSFPKSFMEKIAAKSAQNVTFVLKYKWNHVKQEITIPAFANVDTSLDWYGPAKMAELYGAN